MTRTLRRCGAIVLLAASTLAAAQEISFDAARAGEFITVTASTEMRVDERIAWDVLTDYDHLAQFIPGMTSSRVVLRTADGVLVEQKGEFRFLFFSQPIEVTLAVFEQPRQLVVARAVAGNLRDMEGRYELQPFPGGVKLLYRGRFIPEFSLPPIIGMSIVGHSVERRFRALVEEILRRDALARNKPGP